MGSIMAFLLITCGLLLLLPEAVVDSACVYPFEYRNKIYYSCTKDYYQELWCAFEVNPYTKTMIDWKPCISKEHGGNDGGRACVFPFVYKGETFYTCTKQDSLSSNFWCATTGNFDQDGKWTFCPDTGVQPDGSYKYQ